MPGQSMIPWQERQEREGGTPSDGKPESNTAPGGGTLKQEMSVTDPVPRACVCEQQWSLTAPSLPKKSRESNKVKGKQQMLSLCQGYFLLGNIFQGR